jgi:TusA-related sulfurtransferase
VINRIAPPRVTSANEEKKPGKSTRNVPQYAFMKAPGILHDFQVGKKLEVYCDHDKSKERIRGWIDGTIVQVDNKMVAVQFRSNVYLTDGWMVPDRILWYPLNSEHIRPVGGAKTTKKSRAIPDY